MKITFDVVSADVLPPKSVEYAFMNVSDRHLGKIELVDGDVEYAVIRYDFDRNKWCSSSAGIIKKVIEYYVNPTPSQTTGGVK